MERLVQPVRMSTKGELVIPIPQEVRRRMGLRAGDSLILVAGDDEAILMTARRYAESLRGIGRGIYGATREEIDAYVRGERETWTK